MNPPARAVYVPPRPNPGPEPPQGAGALPWWSIAVGGLLAAVFAARWMAARRRRRLLTHITPTAPAPTPSTARERAIAEAAALRRALAERFGPAWQARTTEEIIGDAALATLLTVPVHERLAAALARADRAKFAELADSEFETMLYGDDPDELVAELAARLRAEAGASTKTSG